MSNSKFNLNVVIASLSALLVGASMMSCADETNITNVGEAPKLVASPDTIRLTDLRLIDTFFVSTNAPGQLAWEITQTPTWATVTPSKGVAKQEIQSISVAIDSTGLEVGAHRGVIEIISTGGEEKVGLVFEMKLHPRFVLSDSSLDFGDNDTLRTIQLRNTGNGSLTWSIVSAASWCSAQYPASGWLSPNDSAALTLTVSRNGLDPGTVNTTVTIRSNSDDGDVLIPISMQVPASAIITPDTSPVVFGFSQDSVSMQIRNHGNVASDFAITFSSSCFSCAPANGNLARDGETEIILTVDRNGLDSDTLPVREALYLHAGASDVDTFEILLYNYQPDLWQFEKRFVDAEYCRTLDKIAAISSDPSQFHLIDPGTNTIQSINLALPPNCVAIRFDGTYAVVGHNALVTYIDISSMQIVSTWSVATDAIDIILPDNGWTYVFPRTDQWSTIHCIELATGLDVGHRGGSIYAGTRARLHPSESYIYGADNGLSPSDFEKYDIRSDTLLYMYDSQYHGDYAFSGDVWIADDGMTLFARSGNIFSSSVTRSLDMVYRGNFAGLSSVSWAEHSSMANRVYVLAGSGYYWDPQPVQLFTYDDEFFAYKGKINLPKFIQPTASGGSLVPMAGRFVFANSTGTQIYVLGTGQQGSVMELTWGMAKLLTQELP